MLSCAICLDTLKSPVALPCGHVYCRECCIHRSATGQHCPTCQRAYRIVNVNPSCIPSYLRPYVFPAKSQSRPSTDIQIPLIDPADIQAENEMLRLSGNMWRTRAEAHAAATIAILNFAHMARDHAEQLRSERDELQLRYDALRRKLEEPEWAEL